MNKVKAKNKKVFHRKKRTRAKISGSSETPRLSVFRSNTYSYVQAIDDTTQKTIASASTIELAKSDAKKKKVEQSELLGELIAKKLLDQGIKSAIFDRGSYRYHGRVKAVAEGARKGGLKV